MSNELAAYAPRPSGKVGARSVTRYREINDLARVAAAAFGASSAAVSFVDPAEGLGLLSTLPVSADVPGPRQFCEHVIGSGELLIVNDARLDPLLDQLAAHMVPRFYAGAPLRAENGACIGTLCVFDDAPRALVSEQQRNVLERLAEITSRLVQIEHSRRVALLQHHVSSVVTDEALGAAVIDSLPVMVFAKDTETRKYVLMNKAGEKFTGLGSGEAIGRTDEEIFPEYAAGFRERDDISLAQSTPFEFESEFFGKDGSLVRLRTKRLVLDVPETGDKLIIGISEDVTEARKAEAEIVRLARFDPVTGIPNRASFTEELHKLIAHRQPFALMSIDLERFNAINDRLGQVAGDEVLREVVSRIKPHLVSSDHISRLGGDEFAIAVVGGNPRARANELAKTLDKAVSAPISTTSGVAHTAAAAGMALYPDDGSTPDDIREKANLALYRVKQRNSANFCWFSRDMDHALSDRRKLESDLRQAVDNDDITVWYQPILNASTGQVDSVEALARWHHPLRGPIPPTHFVSLAEELDLIEQLGRSVLRRACAEAVGWPTNLAVSVNLSPAQFQSGRLLHMVGEALHESGLEAERLHVEVTEGLVIRDVRRTFDQLDKLRALGIHVHVDDFGVGYSSLSYFERFSFDAVKIDRSFVQSVATSHAARAIIRAVVGLARELGMDVVAEGIETESQMQALLSLGCTHLQGFLFSQALPAKSLMPLIEGSRFCNLSASPAAKRYA